MQIRVISLSRIFVLLTGCTNILRLTSLVTGPGNAPKNYEQTIREYLGNTLEYPQSLKDLSVSKPPTLTYCDEGFGDAFYGWRVTVAYTAKNSDGDYVSNTYFYWFHGENVIRISTDADKCP